MIKNKSGGENKIPKRVKISGISFVMILFGKESGSSWILITEMKQAMIVFMDEAVILCVGSGKAANAYGEGHGGQIWDW